jgi:hypothetical protein
MLRATADGLELYLAFGVSGDYVESLWRVMRKQFLVEGTFNCFIFPDDWGAVESYQG